MTDQMEGLKDLARGGGIIIFGSIISKAIIFFYRIFIARYFGPGDYGLFSLALALISIIEVIAMLGLTIGIVRYISYYNAKKNEEKLKGTFLSGYKMAIPVSVILSITVFFLSPIIATHVFGKPELSDIIRIMSFAPPFMVAFRLNISVLTGLKRFSNTVYSDQIAQNFPKLILTLAFGLIGLGLIGITWAWLLAVIFSFFVSVYFVKKHFLSKFGREVKAHNMSRELLLFSIPLLFSTFLAYIMLWTDTIMLGIFARSTDVGIYNAALPTAQILSVFPLSLSQVFFAIITGLYAKKNWKEVKRVYSSLTKWIFYFNVPILLIFLFFSGEVLTAIFGSQYTTGLMAMVILSIGFFLRFSVPAANVISMMNHTKKIMYVNTISLAVNVVLNYFLIQQMGFTGAAIATASTMILVNILFVSISYRLMKFVPLTRRLVKIFLAGASAMFILYTATGIFNDKSEIITLAIIIFSYLVLYGIILVMLRSFDEEDVEVIRLLEKKLGFRIPLIRKLAR